MPILIDEPGKEVLLMGNEAIVRGAVEAGVGFFAQYPGTPSSEIGNLFSQVSKEIGIHFEYSANEKVSVEGAAAAAVSGVRSMAAMKHVGLNVASDAFLTVTYTGVRAGMVVVCAGDPSLHSSQSEQDNRFYTKLAGGLVMLEPSTPKEAYTMVKKAFDISEELELPVLLYTTTRVNHSREGVTLGELPKEWKTKGHFEKDPFRFVVVPAVGRQRHKVALEQMEKALGVSESSPFNFIKGEGKVGIVTSGVSAGYVMDAVEDLGAEEEVSILKLGMTHPLPKKLCESFIKGVGVILVVEELEPYLENEIKVMVADLDLNRRVLGKGSGHFPRLYEFTPDKVKMEIAKVLGVKLEKPETMEVPPLPPRPPLLCPGCPHRATYYAIKMATKGKGIYPTDIGCYTLGLLPPINMADFLLCMGSSVGSVGGFAKVTDQKVISFIGDSTFFHAGIPALINAVHNQHPFLLVIMDNQTTAMTGHQSHPGIGFSSWIGGPPETWVEAPAVPAEEIARGCGVKDVWVVDPHNLKETFMAVRQALEVEGVAVLISRHPCPLLERGE
jgi:indolepyruvate ferredoxin oxidoreductase alpha subunit